MLANGRHHFLVSVAAFLNSQCGRIKSQSSKWNLADQNQCLYYSFGPWMWYGSIVHCGNIMDRISIVVTTSSRVLTPSAGSTFRQIASCDRSVVNVMYSIGNSSSATRLNVRDRLSRSDNCRQHRGYHKCKRSGNSGDSRYWSLVVRK